MILITSNENRILNTIKSRCLKIYFNNIEDDILKKFLRDKYKIDNISFNMLKSFDGSIGKALQIHGKEEEYKTLDQVFNNKERYNLVTATKSLEILYKDKENIQEMLDYINVIFLNKAKENIEYIKYINKIEDVKKRLNGNCNYDMCIDSILFEIWG